MRRAGTALAAGALLLAGCSEGGATQTQLPQPLPSVELAGFDGGRPVDLAEVRGPAVVSFWASYCTPCRKEMPVLEAFHQEHGDRVDLIGIDYQDHDLDKARELVERTGVTYPLYADQPGDLNARAPFPVLRGLPFMAFVDADGQLVHQEYVIIKTSDQLEDLVEEHLGVAL